MSTNPDDYHILDDGLGEETVYGKRHKQGACWCGEHHGGRPPAKVGETVSIRTPPLDMNRADKAIRAGHAVYWHFGRKEWDYGDDSWETMGSSGLHPSEEG